MLIRSIDDYGGPLANYAAVTDPSRDEDARFRNRYVCDGAMVMHTAPRAIVSFVAVNGADPTDPTDFVHDAMWGSSNPVKPVAARTAEGVWTLTYVSTFDDELTAEDAALGGGVSYSTNFRRAYAQATAVAGVLKHAVAEVTAPNIITVRGFLANGTADDIPGATVTVFIY